MFIPFHRNCADLYQHTIYLTWVSQFSLILLFPFLLLFYLHAWLAGKLLTLWNVYSVSSNGQKVQTQCVSSSFSLATAIKAGCYTKSPKKNNYSLRKAYKTNRWCSSCNYFQRKSTRQCNKNNPAIINGLLQRRNAVP